MRLIDAMLRVQKTERNTSDWFSSALLEAAGFNEYELDSSKTYSGRVKEVAVAPWMCTDSQVGLTFIYFDDKPLATGWQVGRKCDNEIKFISRDVFNEFREFLETCREKPEFEDHLFTDPEKPFYQLTYHIHYTGQVMWSLTPRAFYEGVLLDIDVEKTRELDRADYVCRDIALRRGDETIVVSLKDVLFPMLINEAENTNVAD